MRYLKEVVQESNQGYTIHLSLSAIEAAPFTSAKVKQGGYGFHDKDFFVQRIANRGFHVFLFTFSGKGRMVFEDGTELVLKNGDAFISWATGQGHFEECCSEDPWELLWITVWDTSPNYIPDSDDYRVVHFDEQGYALKDFFMKIVQEESLMDAFSTSAIEYYEKLFLITMNRILLLSDNSMDNVHRKKFSVLWGTVESNISKSWTIDALCNEIGYSKPHLSRLCKELYGKSPIEKVIEMKMNNAKLLLQNTEMSIYHIGREVGYDSPSVFSVTFHKHFGLSPRDFRKVGGHRSGSR